MLWCHPCILAHVSSLLFGWFKPQSFQSIHWWHPQDVDYFGHQSFSRSKRDSFLQMKEGWGVRLRSLRHWTSSTISIWQQRTLLVISISIDSSCSYQSFVFACFRLICPAFRTWSHFLHPSEQMSGSSFALFAWVADQPQRPDWQIAKAFAFQPLSCYHRVPVALEKPQIRSAVRSTTYFVLLYSL